MSPRSDTRWAHLSGPGGDTATAPNRRTKTSFETRSSSRVWTARGAEARPVHEAMELSGWRTLGQPAKIWRRKLDIMEVLSTVRHYVVQRCFRLHAGFGSAHRHRIVGAHRPQTFPRINRARTIATSSTGTPLLPRRNSRISSARRPDLSSLPRSSLLSIISPSPCWWAGFPK